MTKNIYSILNNNFIFFSPYLFMSFIWLQNCFMSNWHCQYYSTGVSLLSLSVYRLHKCYFTITCVVYDKSVYICYNNCPRHRLYFIDSKLFLPLGILCVHYASNCFQITNTKMPKRLFLICGAFIFRPTVDFLSFCYQYNSFMMYTSQFCMDQTLTVVKV